MKAFIADGSRVGWKRVSHLVDSVKDLEVIGYADRAASMLQSLKTLKPDLLIVDIEWPDRNGVNILEKIVKELPSLSVIVLTNASAPYYRKRCAAAGVRYFFDKSTEFQSVPDAVRQLMKELYPTE